MCSQRWVKLELENFPFSIFLPVEISILVHPKQISNSDKKGGVRSFAHFHTFPLSFLVFFCSFHNFSFFPLRFPFFSCLLFPFPPLFPHPFPFSSFPPASPSKISPQTFERWTTRSPHLLFTPLILVHQNMS